jgi:transmembrane sensor
VNNSNQDIPPGDATEQQAAAWVLRTDRGLTPAEQDEFSAWLAADPQHGAQLARHRRHWQRLNALADWRPEHAAPPNPDLLAPPRRSARGRRILALATIAVAAVVAVAFSLSRSPSANSTSTIAAANASRVSKPEPSGPRVLPDGTEVELNRSAELVVEFTSAERRVRLVRGEAHFFVTKNPLRPFIVNAGGIDVRAVGTAFNVRIDPATVEVLVTEGIVQVESSPPTGPGPSVANTTTLIPLLEARQRVVVPKSPQVAQPQIATLTPGEIERVLAWQHRLLDFDATPLNEIVAELNRRNVVQLVVIDPELAAIRLSISFRSDNIDTFVRHLEKGFGARAEKRGDTEIVLHKIR